MTLTQTVQKAVAGTLLLAFSQSASALVYSYDDDTGPGGQGARASSVSAQYDTDTEQLNWEAELTIAQSRLATGFWLVLSDGDDARGRGGEYAIFYADLTNNRLSAYVYDGGDASESWRASDQFIQGFEDVLTVTTDGETSSVSFSIDASVINLFLPGDGEGGDWVGTGFSDEIGIWFRPVLLGEVSYNDIGDLDPAVLVAEDPIPMGALTNFDVQRLGLFYTANVATNVVIEPEPSSVPEPGTLLLVILGGSIIVCMTRRRKAVA